MRHRKLLPLHIPTVESHNNNFHWNLNFCYTLYNFLTKSIFQQKMPERILFQLAV